MRCLIVVLAIAQLAVAIPQSRAKDGETTWVPAVAEDRLAERDTAMKPMVVDIQAQSAVTDWLDRMEDLTGKDSFVTKCTSQDIS
jgi:hypothetical protein